MQRLIRTGVLKWARIEVWSHIHGRSRRHYPGLQLLVEHGYRLCDARGKELKLQALNTPAKRDPVYQSMRAMCRKRYRDETKLAKIVHCQDDIEAFHPSVFDHCGGSHGGFV